MPVLSSITFLPVSDIKATYHFYHEILGLPVFQKQGENLCIFDTGYGYLGFCQYADQRKPLSGDKGVCLSFNLSGNEEVLERFEALKDKAEVYKKPAMHQTFPVYSFFLFDPDHYLVEFQKIKD